MGLTLFYFYDNDDDTDVDRDQIDDDNGNDDVRTMMLNVIFVQTRHLLDPLTESLCRFYPCEGSLMDLR